MRREQASPLVGIGAEDGADLRESQVKLAKAADESSVVELCAGIGSVRGLRVDPGRLEQSHLVVVPERADAQPAQSREAADRQELVVHADHPGVSGRSRVKPRPALAAGWA